MNKDMTYLDENTVLVSDEAGNLIKKTNDVNIEKVLETENKIENAQQIIDELKKQIEECDNANNICDFIFKFMIIAAALSASTILLNVPILAIVGMMISFVGSGIIIKTAVKNTNNKNKKGLIAKLDFVKKLEEEYQSELEDVLIKDYSVSELSKDKIFTNEITSIKYSDGLDNSVLNDIDTVYKEAYSNRDKPLRLTKKKNTKKC